MRLKQGPVLDLTSGLERAKSVKRSFTHIAAAYQQRLNPITSLPPTAQPPRGKLTTAPILLDIIKDIEIAISSRKGRSGTVAGDVAFPKGKENLASVLKCYKRRLSNKPVGSHDGPGSRKLLPSAPYAS